MTPPERAARPRRARPRGPVPLIPPGGAGSGPAQSSPPEAAAAQGRPPARLIPAATEAEWLEARRHGVTASEISIVMGLSPWDSPFALYHRKRGDLPPQGGSMAMALGRHLEQFVCDQFQAVHPEFSQDAQAAWSLYAHPDRPWQMATPDRLLHECSGSGLVPELEPSAVLEAKTSAGYDGWGEDGSDDVPVHYRCQVLWQMDVLGVGTGYVACLFLHSRQLRVYELAMDGQAARDLELMRWHALGFLARLREADPPEPDWRPASTDALKRLHPSVRDEDVTVSGLLAGRYLAACRSLAAAKRKKAGYENQLRAALGPARRALDRHGALVATRSVYDVKAHARKASTVDKLIPAKPPAVKETP